MLSQAEKNDIQLGKDLRATERLELSVSYRTIYNVFGSGYDIYCKLIYKDPCRKLFPRIFSISSLEWENQGGE